jgi:sarcosine oxidase
MKVAVVGSGIHGASSANVLAGRGHEVSLYEQFQPLHDRGSSHGESRIVLKAYPDPFYTGLMAEAYPLWRDLELQSGEALLHEVGLAYVGKDDAPNLRTVVDGLSEVGEPFELLSPSNVSSVSRHLRLERNEVAVFTAAAGWVDAGKCTSVTLGLAARSGVSIHPFHRVDRAWLDRNFDAYIVAPGAWIREWVPELEVKVTLQTVAFFEALVDGPVWIEDSDRLAYGFPTRETLGAKVAYHSLGRPIEPESGDREPEGHLLEELGQVLSRRFGTKDPELKRAYGCLYTNTPDEDFRVGRLGHSGFYVSACSGHGFKFGPWIGRLMADFVEGKRTPEGFPRFAPR